MKNKICFVGLDNYPVLNPLRGDEYFGGESVQQTLLAKAFAADGHDVSMIVKDYGQDDGETIDRVKVWKTYKEEAGIPVIRFVYPRMSSIYGALERAGADFYYQSCAGMMTGLVAHYCRANNKKLIFRIAHDTDCIPGKQIIRYWRDRKIYEYGLRRADLVVAQTRKQETMLRENYGITSSVINMTVQIPENVSVKHDRDIDILWVNNLRHFKHPELVIELAMCLPQYRFVMIGGPLPGLEPYYEEIKRKAASARNLEFMGSIPYREVNNYYMKARVFVNTSDTEGFPNSYLQAWARGVPVVSFFDPDKLICEHDLGMSPKNLVEMASSIESILSDSDAWERTSHRVRAFAIENYSSENITRKYIQLISRVA